LFVNIFEVNCMSSDLMISLKKLAEEDKEREEKEFEAGIDRYKSLLMRVSKVRPFELVEQAEGPEFYDLKQVRLDLDVLVRAELLKEQKKETWRSEYSQYDLTEHGELLVEKLSKEKSIDRKGT
jgi:hypothetical protein